MIIDHPAPGEENGLKNLWQAVFQDSRDYIEGFFVHAYAPERCLRIMEDGEAVAMLHWLDMTCRGKRIAYIYAVATRRQYRGRGLCRGLMDAVHGILAERGYAGSALVPQEPALVAMYEKMGYKPFGGITRHFCSAGAPVSLEKLDWQEWNCRRKAMLPPGGVELGDVSAAYLGAMTEFFAGEGLLLVALRADGVLHGIELLGDPAAGPGILAALGCCEGSFLTPGGEPYAMYRGLDGITLLPGYFGIAFD